MSLLDRERLEDNSCLIRSIEILRFTVFQNGGNVQVHDGELVNHRTIFNMKKVHV